MLRRLTRLCSMGAIIIVIARPAPSAHGAPKARVAPAAAKGAAANDEEGRRQFKLGEKLLEEGKYREAAQAFEAGYAASPRAGFLLNIANCYRKLGELGKARQYYWRFLEAAPPNHPSRPAALEYLRAIEEIGADGVSLDNDAAKVVVAPPVGAEPAPAVPLTPPGPAPGSLAAALPPPVVVRLPAKPVSRPAVIEAAPAERVEPRLVARIPRPEPAGLSVQAPPPGRTEADAPQHSLLGRWWFWPAVGAVVIAGTGAALWAHSSPAASCHASLGCLNE